MSCVNNPYMSDLILTPPRSRFRSASYLVCALLLCCIISITVSAAPTDTSIIGIEWDRSNSSTDALTWINATGTTISAPDFDNHVIWGNIKRVVLSYDGDDIVVSYGTNNRGDNLTLNGSEGEVMVEIPKFYLKTYQSGDIYRWWISPAPATGYTLFPAFVQRGGTERPHIYVGAFEAHGYDDAGTFKLGSATGKRPVTGASSYPSLPNSGRFTINDAEEYANNIGDGDGWGNINIYSYSAIRLLYLTEYADWDAQETIGLGIVSKASGTGFAGSYTGIDSINTNIDSQGTGTGTGTSGYTPVAYRGMENLWGNTYSFISGYTATNDEYHIINANGTGSMATHPLASGNYTASSATPLYSGSSYVYGYWSSLETESLLMPLMIPSSLSGGDYNKYGADYFYSHHPPNTPTILLAGGCWNNARLAGLGYLHSTNAASLSGCYFGARLEFTGAVLVPEPPVATFTSDYAEGAYQITFTDTSTPGTGTITNWLWDFGDGTNSTLQNPTKTYLEEGTYNVSLTVVDDNGLSDTHTETDYISIIPFTVSPDVADVAETITFTQTVTLGAEYDTYAWRYRTSGTEPWSAAFASEKNASVTGFGNGTYDIQFTAYGDGEATLNFIRTAILDIGYKPAANFTASPLTEVDPADPLQFTDHSTHSPTTWLWQYRAAGTDDAWAAFPANSTVQHPTNTGLPSGGILDIRLNATNIYGSDTFSRNAYVSISMPPVAGFSASTTSAYSRQPIQFTDHSTYTPTTWLWDFGDGTTSTLQNPIKKFTRGGLYEVSLNATNSFGSDTTAATTITITGSDFSAFSLQPMIGDPVTFSDLAAYPPDTGWLWDFGDGTTSTLQNPQHTYTTAGTYSPRLIYIDTAGNESVTKTNYVIVSSDVPDPSVPGIPKAAFTVDLRHPPPGDVTFTDGSSGVPTTWLWHRRVSGTEEWQYFSNDQHPTQAFPDPGWYDIRLTVSNIHGTGQEIRERYLGVGQALRPKAVATFAPLDLSSYSLLLGSIGGDEPVNESSAGIDWMQMGGAVESLYTGLVGSLLYLVAFAIPFGIQWIRQGNMAIPGTIGIIIGAYLLTMTPAEYHLFAVTAIAFSVLAVIWGVIKER